MARSACRWLVSGSLLGCMLLCAAHASADPRRSPVLPLSHEVRLGDSWDKALVTRKNFGNLPEPVQKLVLATAFVSFEHRSTGSMNQGSGVLPAPTDGSAIYLGRFQGEHLMVTNSHVISSQGVCANTVVAFEDFRRKEKRKFRCKELWITLPLGASDRNDVSFFTIDAQFDPWGRPWRARSNEAFLLGREVAMDFHAPVFAGQELVQSGYGELRDIPHGITVQQGGDCMVLSQETQEVRVRSGDRLYTVDAIAVGCDGAKKDSGSGVMDRVSGKIVGLFSAAGYSLNEEGRPVSFDPWFQNSVHLRNLISNFDSGPGITNLNWMLPASDIGRKIQMKLDGSEGRYHASILEGMRELIARR